MWWNLRFVFLAQNLTQEDVFGGDLTDLSEDEDGVRRTKQEDNDLNGDQVCFSIDFYLQIKKQQMFTLKQAEDDELLEEQEEEQIAVDAPHVRCDLGRDIHLVKLPSFMTVEPK